MTAAREVKMENSPGAGKESLGRGRRRDKLIEIDRDSPLGLSIFGLPNDGCSSLQSLVCSSILMGVIKMNRSQSQNV